MLRVVVCVAALGLATAASADDGAAAPDKDSKDTAGVADVFAHFGYTTDKASTYAARNCRVAFDLDQKQFVDGIPELKKLDMLNPDLSQASINSMPNTISLAFIQEMLPLVIKTTYDSHADVDQCNFTQYLTVVDDYGNDKREPVATFGFTRALYGKINWDKFENEKLAKVAPGFHWSPDIMRAVVQERQ